ncbi:MAG TPA: type II toxin-antitoxin system RelE/ParE family toxin [Patescibacteria group bacterium]|nr:type II toxin-antitoxin system RelE/ParE family toxin [Patescibacteria group bacterium]
MQYVVRVKPSVEKELANISLEARGSVQAALIMIAANPLAGRKLHGKHADFHTLHFWPHRLIYRIHRREAMVIVIGIAQG